MFAGANGLDPTAFPSLLRMENDLVASAGRLLDAPDGFVGSATSGRHRVDPPRGPRRPRGRAARHEARAWCSRRAPTRPSSRRRSTSGCAPSSSTSTPTTLRADPAAMAAAVDDSTVLVVASAPSYAHGVVDPVAEIAALAAGRGIRCHVDACIGGWVLPHLDHPRAVDLRGRGGHEHERGPPQVRLHEQGRLPPPPPQPRAAAWPPLRLGRLARLHDAQRDDAVHPVGWPPRGRLGRDAHHRGGAVRRPGPRGARGDPRHRGRRARHRRASTSSSSPTARCSPSSPTAPATSSPSPTRCSRAGWFTQPQMAFRDVPPTLHLTLSAATAPSVPDFLSALAEATAAAREAGPVSVDPAPRRPRRRDRPRHPRRGGVRRPAGGGGSRGQRTAASPCPSGWRPSTPSSTPARRRCARRSCSGSSTACRARRPPERTPAPPGCPPGRRRVG